MLSNSSLGGTFMDKQVSEFIVEAVVAAGLDASDEKSRAVILDEAKRAKERLTVQDFVDIRLDELFDNFTCRLDRSQFNSMIGVFNDTLRLIFENVTADLSTGIHSVELIGGASRVPFVKDCLASLIDSQKIGRTMNSDEAAAIGAAYINAVSDRKLFGLQSIRIATFVNSRIMLCHPQGCNILYGTNMKTSTKPSKVFSVATMDVDYWISINRVNLTSFHVDLPEDVGRNDYIKFVFAMTRLGVPVLQSATINKTVKVGITFSPSSLLLTPTEMNESLLFMQKTKRFVENRGKIGKMRSDCEEFIETMNGRLVEDSVLLSVLNESELESLKDAFRDAGIWYDSTRNALVKFNDFAEKFKALRAIAHNGLVRADLVRNRGPSVQKMNYTLARVEAVLNGNSTEIVITPSEWKIKELSAMYNKTRDWFVNVVQAEASPVLPAAIDYKQDELEALFNFTVGIKQLGGSSEPQILTDNPVREL
jgi:hypothetical protein